jgi:hypothetical protein
MKKRIVILSMMLMGFSGGIYARDIKSLKIDSVGLSEVEDEYVDNCKLFKPTKKQVALYFSKSYPVDNKLSVHKFWSPCHAKGTIEFVDGNKGTWILKSSGIAIITWVNSGDVVLLYRGNKWNDPFVRTYDDNGV